MAAGNPLHKLASIGQSVWLDFLERGFVARGELAALIRDDAVSGVTSNPTIFHKAITEHAIYDAAIEQMARAGLAAHEIHEALIIEDIRAAADELAGVFERTGGRDGFVSVEISPHFAHDVSGSYWEAKRLWALVNRPNLMVKVPGTREALPVVRQLTADGLNVNITLLFDVERYSAVAEAYLAGLEDRAARGLQVSQVASVASFFLSRIDASIDAKLDAAGAPQPSSMRGQCALACAQAAYVHYRSTVSTPRWEALARRGARSQRLLWASTAVKDSRERDVKYVEALALQDTVTTLPPQTLIAYRDHGQPARLSVKASPDIDELARKLADAGIVLCAVTRELEEEGIRKFIQPHEATLTALRERIAAVKR